LLLGLCKGDESAKGVFTATGKVVHGSVVALHRAEDLRSVARPNADLEQFADAAPTVVCSVMTEDQA
jgi:hypothetical protein